jgi:hypothetical protein
MSTLWVRRQLRRSQRREAWRLASFALFGIAFGVAAFFALESTDPQPPASQEVRPSQPFVASLDGSNARVDDRVSPSPQTPFRNCAQARAAGAAPVHRGDPGYGEHLDGDLDGVGCEPYRR